MDNKTVLIVILLVVFFAWGGCSPSAADSGPRQPVSQSDCVAAIQAQYSGQWANMNQLQRAAVGLQAASCGEVR